MADEKTEQPKTLLRFRANLKSPTVEIAQGEYRRKFDVADQPFAVENEEEARMLRETGHFVEDKEAEKDQEQEASRETAEDSSSKTSRRSGKTPPPPPPPADRRPSS